MEALRPWVDWLKARWNQLSATNRLLVKVGAAAALLAIGATLYLRQSNYQPMFVGLSPEEVGAITARLKANGVSYRLDHGGTAILVPEDQAAQVRVDLAAEGLPAQGSKGYELLEESSLMTTPRRERINYLRAVEGELARTIIKLKPIAAARVHIVKPPDTPFHRDEKPTTASVMVRLRGGVPINRSVVDSIVALVSRAVEGLTPENVAVVDDQGRLLSDARSPEQKLTARQEEYRKDLENDLSLKAEEMLTRHLGVGRAIVRITADVNVRSIQEKTETYDDDSKALIEASLRTGKSTTPPTPRGPAGTTSNTNPTAPGGNGQSLEEDSVNKYVPSKTERTLEQRLQTVERLTIAAMLDLGDEDEDGPTLSVVDAEKIIKNAVGFKEGRDSISVVPVKLGSNVAFTDEDEQAARMRRIQGYVSLARNVMVTGGLLLIVLTGILILRRLRPVPAPTPAAQSDDEAAIRELNEFVDLARRDPDRAARGLAMLLT